MPFTLAGWTESQDSAAVLVQAAALSDQSLSTSGDDIFVPDFAPNLMGAFALGATISQAQITSPSLRKGTQWDISPINIGAEPIFPLPWLERFFTPRPLVPGEGLRGLVAEAAAGAEQDTLLCWLGDTIDAMPSGEIQTIRATNGSTLVAYAWTIGTLTLSQQLEAGRYAIVGMRALSAGLIAARLVIPGSPFRPGCVGVDLSTDAPPEIFRHGGLGNWGEFEHTYVPQVEFLSASADTAQVVHLDVIKVG